MDKPLLKDYGLTPGLAQEIIVANKRRYRLFWWTVNGCVIVVILLVALFLPVSMNARVAVVAGLIVIFYTLNYASAFKRIAIRIFEEHPQEKSLKRYVEAMRRYNAEQNKTESHGKSL